MEVQILPPFLTKTDQSSITQTVFRLVDLHIFESSNSLDIDHTQISISLDFVNVLICSIIMNMIS